jgi:penicillin-binding protein 2
MFTPIQLANYCAPIANGGTHYALPLLSKVKSADYTEVTHAPDPRVLNTIAERDYIRILQEGMEAVTVGEGSAQPVFEDAPVKVAAKTGTVQSDGTTVTNGVFVCYAPAEDPEIAIAVVVNRANPASRQSRPDRLWTTILERRGELVARSTAASVM